MGGEAGRQESTQKRAANHTEAEQGISEDPSI